MQLTGLLTLLRANQTYQHLLTQLTKDNVNHDYGIVRSARPYLLAALAQDWHAPVIYLTGRIKRAYNVAEQLPVWAGDATEVLRYTEPTPQFYERAAWGDAAIRGRLETLAALMDDDTHENAVAVASARALMQRTMPPNQFRRRTITLRPGDRWQLDKLLSKWQSLGYEGAQIVVEPGTFSRRGGVLDIFPVAADQPVRIDFFDDEIESLRRFDPSTQRSAEEIDRLTVTPAREGLPEYLPQIAAHLEDWFASLPAADADMTTAITDLELMQTGASFAYMEHYLPYMYAHPVGLLDYAPDDALIVVEDIDALRETINDLADQAEDRREMLQNSNELHADHPQPYVGWDVIEAALAERRVLHLTTSGGPFQPGERFGGQLRPMLNSLRERYRDGDRVIVVSEQAPRITQLWHEQDASAFIPTHTDLDTLTEADRLVFINGTLSEGWVLEDGERTHLLSDAEIFGWNRPEPGRRKTRKGKRTPETNYSDWRDGDFVVHTDHGIGQFAGMRHRTVDGNDREYLLIQYEGADMLFVPIHQTDRLMKYIGADDTPPKLNSLGKKDWQKVKGRVKKAVEEEAHGLLELYAARANATGHAYTPDTPWQHELEASFPYVETDDQLRSLQEVKQDMQTAHPMDRLICGDVGYGKTEIALRAAFKAVMEGKQVAVLVPTTVLAQQHFDTFTNRLARFPVNVEMLSRFRTKEYQSRVLPKIASGEIDIVIGTHRILSNDVTFKDLGLIVIDEEQRFGVKHKEHFKSLRAQVDVLTLTATPIPRTLYMSLTGVRDISMIQTPPEERLPIITHVGKLDPHLVRQAVLREIERGGQIFVVHNRVKSIHALEERFEEIVPEARIVVGHGQMRERELERVMSAFGRGEYDILMSTAIIESGIDIPNANTLIVDRADMFGVAQLYQLRGRVGRSAQQAYAYLFHSGKLTGEARERLDTLAENTSLGSGFQISMRDLEIRGAGDILSTKQTGHVAAIGLNLYTQLLQQSISKLKGETDTRPASEASIVIDLPLPAYVPDDWIPDMALRLQIYRRIAGLSTLEQIDAMRDELRDRFGQTPRAVDGLMYQIEVKLLAQQAIATHVIGRDDLMQIKLPYLGEVNREALAHKLGDEVRVSRTAVAFPMGDDDTWQLQLTDILGQLNQQAEMVSEGGVGL